MGGRGSGNPAWKKGMVSANPSGRPKTDLDIQSVARQKVPAAIKALEDALTDTKSRVAAAQIILAYAYGRPMQNINARLIRSVEDLSEKELLAIAGLQAEDGGDGTVH